MNLEDIARKMSHMNVGEQEGLLRSLGRIQHIEFETGESTKLARENPERFMKIGSKTIDRKSYGQSDEEYKKACISNAKFLYERFPLIFEFYDELMNGIVLQETIKPKLEESRGLEDIARKMSHMNVGEQEGLLRSLGRIQHIEFETGESTKLARENPERFMKIGSKTIDRKSYGQSDEEYKKACISNAKFLYERFPLIFEFYDELMNGIVLQETIKQKGR